MVKYSVVIPVYNTSQILFELCERIDNIFESINESYEIILIDDHSPKVETWSTLEKIYEINKNVIVAQLLRNFGQQAATMCGLSLATGEYIITMDDDLQHDPKDIPKLIKYQNHKIVIAHLIDKKHNFAKKFTSRLKERFDRIIFKKPKNIQLSAFRLIHREIIDVMLLIKTPTPYISDLMFFASKDVKGIQIKHNKRKEGVSGYSFLKLIKLFSYLIINHSSIALRIIGQFGFLIFSVSLILIMLLLYKYFINLNNVPGWTSVMVGLLFFGGIQLFTIGIIGEYLIRIIKYNENKPAFIIGKILSSKES